MYNIFKYNDFMNNLILEKEEIKLMFVLSNRLYKLLKIIDHPIAKDILYYYRNESETTITYLDYDDTNISNFIYTPSSKILNIIEKLPTNSSKMNMDIEQIFKNFHSYDEKLFKTKNSISSSIGKVVNKLFPNMYKPSGEPGNDIESFANLIKNKLNNNLDKFKIVEGEDIIKYYNQNNYDSRSDGSSLGNSCMRYGSKSLLINFYAINPVQMVILMSEKEEGKIVGRALLWKLVDMKNENEYYDGEDNRYFMDRIYTIFHYDTIKFKEYANKNGWLYKTQQDMDNTTDIYDPKTDKKLNAHLKTCNGFIINEFKKYPFMDTMKWFYIDNGFLTNYSDKSLDDNIYYMEATDGTPDIVQGDIDEDHEGQIYIDGEWYDESETVYCELGEQTVHIDDATYCSYYEQYATDRYVSRNMVWSRFHDSYLKDDDCIYSQFYGDNLLNDETVKVYTTLNLKHNDYDYFFNDDKNENYIQYAEDGTDYDIDDECDNRYAMNLVNKGYFVKVYTSLEGNEYKWYKKIEDKDKYVIWNDICYLKKLSK